MAEARAGTIPGETSTADTTSQTFSEKVTDFSTKVASKGREFGSRIVEKASGIGAGADSAIASAGARMSDAAQKLREKAPTEGRLAGAAESVANTLESGGRYLSTSDVETIGEDVTNVIRKYPIRSLWVGVGMGFILSRTLSRRR